ncbi:EamA family transporter [Roseateles sp. DAIF2]|uniref:EamA family transporter n=1 Tax=Roseateles sp. DAIF2 TaxID=2714952 RepID=UPI001BCA66CB|nr:EamA family transporter [Roseateles sp. DAIF2]
MPARHLLLALVVVAIWGSNFVVIKLALGALPPLLFAALRFAFAVLPAIFFLPRPPTSWRNLAAYGLLIGVGQFGVLYLAMRAQISPGLASLVVQTQVFFTLLLAVRLAREHVQAYQWAGLALAASGIGVIALHTDGSTTVLGVAMVLLAAFSWACGNMVGKRAGQVNMLAYMVWTSLFAVPPLILLSLLVEGPAAIAAGLARADAGTWAAVLWQSLGNTLFGYGMWGWLLARHAAATVVPLALLVPVFGMGSAALFLGEPLPAWKLGAAALVMSGLALNLLWPLRHRLRPA